MNSTPVGNTRPFSQTGRRIFSRSKSHRDSEDMPITSLADLERVANATLKAAMADERSKRWTKVIKSYRRLLRMLHKENLPQSFEVPPWYRMLMYESHFHLGLALQNIGEGRRAVQQYTKALEAVFIPKNGCEAGCVANSCLMTPLYTRRSFAHCAVGDFKKALKDAEKGVVLDNKNPDVYCVRALVRNTRGEESEALSDVQTALNLNPNHLCSLILRGTLAQPLASDDIFTVGDVSNEDHILACSINPDCHNFLGVTDFAHEDILTFYDRFLYSLNIPHTVSELDLVSYGPTPTEPIPQGSRPPTHQTVIRDSSQTTTPGDPTHTGSAKPLKFRQQNLYFVSGGTRAFKCGMQNEENCGSMQIMVRRKQYGQAIREHMQRPKTADQYLAFLEKERLRKRIEANRQKRVRSAQEKEIQRNTPKPFKYNAPSTGDAELDRIAASLRTNKTADGRTTRTTQTVITTEPARVATATKRPVKVFMEINVDDAPRMYYKPWSGDKLPVAEVPRRVPAPCFKV